MNGKTAKLYRKYAKELGIEREGYRRLKKNHKDANKEGKIAALSLVRRTLSAVK